MLALPMEIVGPVVGFGAIISFIVAGIVVVRRTAPASQPHHLDPNERLMLEDLQSRLAEFDEIKQRVGELEERVDFSERLLAKRSDQQP